jgi:hypothetical protein
MNMAEKILFQLGSVSESGKDYLEECRKLSPQERIACIQRLRVAFWGDEAATGRLQRIPQFLKRKAG